MARDNIRRTIFLPKYWSLRDLMYPQQSVSENLLIVHDMEYDGEFDCDERRQELLTLSDELDEVAEVTRSASGNVVFEIDLGGIPLGRRQDIAAQLTLGELLENAWGRDHGLHRGHRKLDKRLVCYACLDQALDRRGW